MESQRILTAFRLRSDLVATLKLRAKAENRSLSNCVENILLDSLYHTPNEVTAAAISEASSGISAGTFDTSSPQAFINSIFGDEEI